MAILEIKEMRVYYGRALILDDIELEVNQGELVGVIGPNGAGKTTLLRAISKLIPVEGSIFFKGDKIDSLKPDKIVKLGIIQCPQGRHLFPDLSVLDNIRMGAYLRTDKKRIEQDIENSFEMFPILNERKKQFASTLSGGEQQMLTIARALMSGPSILLLDEPSTGLAPLVRENISAKIKEIQGRGITILLVEQDTEMAFDITERIYVLEGGKIVLEGATKDIAFNPRVKEIYLGIT